MRVSVCASVRTCVFITAVDVVDMCVSKSIYSTIVSQFRKETVNVAMVTMR